jgi:hypothetical protein
LRQRGNASRLALWGAALTVSATAQAGLPEISNGASDQACVHVGVLYDIDHANRQKLEKILDDASRVDNGQAILWRIEKPGLPKSYLFGTVHVIDKSLQDLSPAVRSALDDSKIVAVESIEGSRRANTLAMAETVPLMVSTDKELQRILDDDELTVVEKALTDAGYPSEMALGLKPWAATMFLADSECQKEDEARGLKSVDRIIKDRATADGLPVVGLETIAEQYRSLASIADADQIAWLKASIKLHDRVDDVSQTMSELYRFRLLSAVWPLTQALAPEAGLDDATLHSLQNELISKRNRRMLDHAMPLLREGGVFIAVGALHQSGPDGLVSLLRGEGFTVTAVE